MKVVIAPDSFKGSLSAVGVAEAMSEGVRAALPDAEIVLLPLADGGEGTVEALVMATGGRIVSAPATDPLGNQIESFYGILGDCETAVVEMAAASGLPLVPLELRNPLKTTTYGTGELIKAALDSGCRKLILGIGGSATNDGGIGAVQALGVSFKDSNGLEVGFGGRELVRIATIDVSKTDPRLCETQVMVACDVTNPLTGPLGASAVFGPQKGASPEMVAELDAGLANLAVIIREQLGIEIEQMPGAGAAGGLGAGAVAFLGAKLMSGIEIVLGAVHFTELLADASLVITGEGRIDSQTLGGKTISGVLKAAREANVPVLAIGGGVTPEGYDLLNHGAIAVLSIVNKPMTLEEALVNATELLSRITEQAMRLVEFKDQAR